MFWNIFGKDKQVANVSPEPEVVLRETVRFMVENGFVPIYAPGGVAEISPIRSIPLPQAVSDSLALLAKKTPSELLDYQQLVKKQLSLNALAEEIVENINNDHREAVRSRVMVKAVRAGLDKSDMFLKLLTEPKLKEIMGIERWVERSNAYQGYLETVK